MRTLLLLFVLGSAALTGCTSTGGNDADARLRHADVPKCREQAKAMEDQAIKEVRKGNRRIDERKRLEHYERAIRQLQDARRLYDEELTSDPGSPDKQHAIQAEVKRLDSRIAELNRTKPALRPGG